MAKQITMPAGGQTSDSSKIYKWHKNVGDSVRRGDVLFEIETDKAVLEVESYADGYLIAKYYDEGDEVTAGEAVAYIGAKGEKVERAGQNPVASIGTLKETTDEQEDEYTPIIGNHLQTSVQQTSEMEERNNDFTGEILASPLAKETARRQGVDIEIVAASMSGCVIHNQDILNYKKMSSQTYSEKAEQGLSTIVPNDKLRKTIARRMVDSLATSAHYSIFVDVDMGKIISLRQNFNKILSEKGEKLSINDFIIKCLAAAVQKVPEVNASYAPEETTLWKDVNVGVAVSVDDGIMVPVVHGCQKLSLREIGAKNRENISAIRAGKPSQSMLTGGTITISNMGMFSVSSFTSIINQPESTILSIGAIEDRAVVVDGQIVIRPMMTITATFDHRIIDGAKGAKFVNILKEYLGSPSLLLL